MVELENQYIRLSTIHARVVLKIVPDDLSHEIIIPYTLALPIL